MKRLLLFSIALAPLIGLSAVAPASAQVMPGNGEWIEIPNTQLLPHLPNKPMLGELSCAADPVCNALTGSARAAEVTVRGDAWDLEGRCAKRSQLEAWTGMAYDPESRVVHFPIPGGHDDGGCGDGYEFDFNTLTWSRSEEVQHLTVQTGQVGATGNPVCNWPTIGGPSTHSYDGVELVGPNKLIVIGLIGSCRGIYMAPGNFAFLMDKTTEPPTWTQLTELEGEIKLARINATVVDDYIYTVTHEGRWAKLDKTTGSIVANGVITGVIRDGITQPWVPTFGSQLGAADLLPNGLMCMTQGVNGAGWLQCTNVHGGVWIDDKGTPETTDDTYNDDSFGRFQRYPMGTNAPLGTVERTAPFAKTAVAAGPDGKFMVWAGRTNIWRVLPPEPRTNGAAVWEAFTPASGPTTGTLNVYSKMFWIEHLGAFAGYADKTKGWQLYRTEDYVPPPPPPPPPPEESLTYFQRRCAEPGVFFCQDFNAAVPYTPGLNQAEGYTWPETNPNAIEPQFADGHMRMFVPSECGQSCGGYYYRDFASADGVNVGPGGSIFIQWQQRFDDAFLHTAFQHQDGGQTTWKQMILSQAGETSDNSSCTRNHVVLTTKTWLRPDGMVERTPLLYGQCRPSQNVEVRSIQIGGSWKFDSQPIGSVSPSLNRMCIGNHDQGYLPNCYRYITGPWHTVQIGLTADAESHLDALGRERWWVRHQMWIGRKGEPVELVVDTMVEKASVDLGWGRLWLMNFMTLKDPAQVHPLTWTDYDNLILSTDRISDPV